MVTGRQWVIYNVQYTEVSSESHAYRTRSGSDGMLPLKLSLRSGRYRSRFCNVASLGMRKDSTNPLPWRRYEEAESC